MLKSKKVVSLLLAMAMVLALGAISVFANGDDSELPPYSVVSYDEILHMINGSQSGIGPYIDLSEPCVIPANNQAGTNGNSVGFFTADKTNVSFAVSGGAADKTYNLVLYKDNGAGHAPTQIRQFTPPYFGTGISQGGLTIGTSYFFKISTDDYPYDINGSFVLHTF